MERTPAVPQRTRRGRPGYDQEQMLEIIIGVFNDRGYDAASLEIIAKRLGLSKSAVYHHFDSKSAMLDLALERVLGALEAVFASPEASEGPAVGRVDAVVRAAVEVACEQHHALTLLLRLRGNSDVELRAMQRRRDVDAQLRAIFEQSRAEGTLRPEFDPGLAERFTFGLINSIVEWYKPEGNLTPTQIADAVMLLLAGGLTPASEQP